MNYSLSNMLSSNASGIDSDAKAYIAAVVAAGATVTPTQSTSINTFVKAEKASSRWNSIKRFYLPIWGIASPNAICMKSLTSGTFINAPTMGAGFVKGNGFSSYFDTGASCVGVGITPGSSHIFALVKAKTNSVVFTTNIGASQVASKILRLVRNNTTDEAAAGAQLNGGAGTGNGIFIASETATNSRYLAQRNLSGYASRVTSTSSNADQYSSANVFSMSLSFNGVPTQYSDAELGVFGFGLAIPSSEASDYTLNIKNLWETCTGLTIPT